MRLIISLALVSACILGLCAKAQPARADADAMPAISGMALIEGRSFLVVMDTKADKDSDRVGVINVGPEGGYVYAPVKVDWPGAPSNDLESACPLPGKPGEFLVCESGSWTDRATGEFHQGRIFHLSVTKASGAWAVQVLGTLPVPLELHEVEGIVAMYGHSGPREISANAGYDSEYRESTRSAQRYGQGDDSAQPMPQGPPLPPVPAPPAPPPASNVPTNTVIYNEMPRQPSLLLVMGVRGGGTPYAPAVLHWGYADLDAGTIEVMEKDGLPLEHLSSGNAEARGCSDLYLDPSGVLWVATAEDPGDAGPFRSTVWRFGPFLPDRLSAFDYYFYTDQLSRNNVSWVMDGIKIEAIAAPVIAGSILSYATDDESYGGIWRPLGPAEAQY